MSKELILIFVPILLQASLPLILKWERCRKNFIYLFFSLSQDFFLISLFPVLGWGGLFLNWLNHLYLFSDWFLYSQMKLRLEPSYFLYARDYPYWISSARTMKWNRFLFGGSFITLIHLFSFYFGKRASFDPFFTLFSASFSLFSFFWIPKGAQYLLNHPLFLYSKKEAGKVTIPIIPSVPKGDKQFDFQIDPDEKPHLVFLFLESFGAKHVGPKTTPNFNRFKSEGVYFTNFYSNGTFTYRALLSALFGTPAGTTASGLSPYVNAPLRGIPELMKKEGYKRAFHHNGSLRYDMQEPFLKNHFDELTDQNGIEGSPSSSWGIADEDLMRHSAAWLEKQTKPSFLTLFTISNHHPWIIPKGYQAPEGDRFFQTLHYSDYALGCFLDLLRGKKLTERTILFIMGDHGQPMGEHQENFYNSRFVYEENVRVPLLILAEGRIKEGKSISDLTSHLDLFPTVADLFGIEERCLGTSLMRKSEKRAVFLHNPYSEGFIGWREGNWKWIENLKGEKEELYNLAQDPDEKHNLISEQGEMAAELREKGRSFAAQIDQMHRSLIPNKSVESGLNLSDSLITDQELEKIARFDLIQIHLENCPLLTDRGVEAFFKKAPQLEEVNLKGITGLSSQVFKTTLSELAVLYLSEPIETKEKLKFGGKLKVFSFHGKNMPNWDVESLIYLTIHEAHEASEESLIQFLKNNPNLVRLTLYGCENLTDRTLDLLKTFPLEQLRLYNAPRITEKGKALFPKIRSLLIQNE